MTTGQSTVAGNSQPTQVNGDSVTENNERTPLLNDYNKTLPPAEVTQPGSNDEEQTIVAEEVKGFKLWLILCTCWVGVFLGAIDSTIIATLSAPISSEFKSLSLLSWLATAYLISNAVSITEHPRLAPERLLRTSNSNIAIGYVLYVIARGRFL